MVAVPLPGSGALVALQVALAATGLSALAVMPPSDGPMALIALDGRSADRLVAAALADGAQVLGRGPLANMLIVRGNRAAIAGDMLARGVIVVAAPDRWCNSAKEPAT